MKAPSFAPAYVGLYPHLAEVARSCGYALAVHGSMSRDFDLVAIPWTEKAKPADDLIRDIIRRISFTMPPGIVADSERLFQIPYTELKPHGRKSWMIPLDSGASIDISVMPRLYSETD